MKRVLSVLLTLAVVGVFTLPAQAKEQSEQKPKVYQSKIEKSIYNNVISVIKQQDKLVEKFNFEGLKELYADNFINNDGYNKDVYFSLVKDTWEAYPNITYKTYIKDFKINGNYAIVETYETAVATLESDSDLINAVGELNAYSNCRYHLEKLSDKWVITGEDILEEYSTLKFGDARFVKMNFSAPSMVGAGQPYTATLKIDLPSNQIVIASINNEKIVNPSKKPEEKFRRLPEEQILERMFIANTDNLNEYNVASVGITKAEVSGTDNLRVYMNGLAFIMTRVNVVPKNNFAKVEGSNE